ncbi:MAG: VanZ family protein [Acidobacteriia bacterium]|nr:VanZ family protein [Terriglobia bacterium]
MYRILLIVCALIVYGSLYPFQFQFHATALSAGPLFILLHSWPSHIDRFLLRDILVNIAIYMPLGMFGLLAFAGEGAAHGARAVAATVLLALALSASMEMLQVFDDSRECALSDVATNVAGACLGAALGAMYRRSLGRALSRLEGGRLFHVSSAMLLLYCWAAYQVFPLFPALGRAQLKAHVRFLLAADSFQAIDFLCSLAAWMAAACLLEGLLGAAPVRKILPLFLALLPLRLAIAGRTIGAAELAGALAAWGAWSFWLAHRRRRAQILAALFFVLLAVRGLATSPLAASPQPFSWIPFAAALAANWISVVAILLLKTYWYGAAIWLCREAGARFILAIAVVAAWLAAIEFLQRWLPAHVPEITDPLMAILLGAVLWLAERHHQALLSREEAGDS